MSRSAWRPAIALACGLPIAAAWDPTLAQEQKDVVARIEFITNLPDEGACVGATHRIGISALNRYGALVPAEGRMTGARYAGEAPRYAVEKDPFPLTFVYQPFRWQRAAKEELTFEVRGFDPEQRTVSRKLRFRVRHCLGGRWTDGKRTFNIKHEGNSVVAEVVSGQTCNRHISPKFTGTLRGEKLIVKDLVVCEPEQCARSQGRKQKRYDKRWKAVVSPDGLTISGQWKQDWFDFIDSGGGRITCQLNPGKAKWVDYTIRRARPIPE